LKNIDYSLNLFGLFWWLKKFYLKERKKAKKERKPMLKAGRGQNARLIRRLSRSKLKN
jgi:hypothetical protein